MYEFSWGPSDCALLGRHVPFETWLAIYHDAEKPSELENLAISVMAYLALQEVKDETVLRQLQRARTIGDFREFVISSDPVDKLGRVALAQARRIGRGAAELVFDQLIDDRQRALPVK